MVKTAREEHEGILLELRGVCKSFEIGGESVIAAANHSIQIGWGEQVVIVGINGSGKSTLLRLIAGELSPDAGTIWFNGCDITSYPVERRAKWIGRVFQDIDSGTFSHLTVKENLALSLVGQRCPALRMPSMAIPDELAHAIPWLSERIEQPARLLSGGERQALAVVMQLVRSTDVLLLDEFTKSLDHHAHRSLLEVTHSLVEQRHLTTLTVTQDLGYACSHGARLLVMRKGKIAEDIQKKSSPQLTVESLRRLLNGETELGGTPPRRQDG